MFETFDNGTTPDEPSSTSAPVKSLSIENLLRVRDGIKSRIEQAHALLVEAERMAKGAALDMARISVEARRTTYGPDFFDAGTPDYLLKIVDASAWLMLMKESGLLTFMDAAARSQWNSNCHDLRAPELTKENIAATFAELHASRGSFLRRGVVNVFKRLSWNHKTNLPHKFGAKLIKQRMVSLWGPNYCYMSFTSQGINALDDLERVFCKLRNQPEPDHRDGWSHRLQKVEKTTRVAESDTMSVRYFKNGNAHVTFKDAELVDELNRLLSLEYPNALPPAR